MTIFTIKPVYCRIRITCGK